MLASVSRLTPYIVDEEHKKAIESLKKVLSYYSDAEDLIQIGAYVKGSDKNVDWAIEKIDQVYNFLTQDIFEGFGFEEIRGMLIELFK